MGGSLGVLQLWLSPEEICSRTVTDPVWKGRDLQWTGVISAGLQRSCMHAVEGDKEERLKGRRLKRESIWRS